MRDLCRHVYGARYRRQCIQIFGEAFPIPLQALGEGDAWDLLHCLHEGNELLVVLSADRRETDTTVSKKDGGHAVPGRRRKHRVPSSLAIVVGMRIHPSWCDHQTHGIDLALTGPGFTANLGYAIAVQSEVTSEAWP